MRMKKLLPLFVAVLWGIASAATPVPPYDESAEPHAQLQAALQDAQRSHKDVLIVFGANWCPDCRELDRAMHGSSAGLIDARFIVVKVDVGNFDRHLDIASHYGNPIAKGIPAAVLVTGGDQVLYTTRAGELANARRMGEQGIYDFFAGVIDSKLAH
jgi:thioredoxin 1